VAFGSNAANGERGWTERSAIDIVKAGRPAYRRRLHRHHARRTIRVKVHSHWHALGARSRPSL